VASELRELVEPATAERIVVAISVVIALCGLAGGMVAGIVRGPFMRNFLRGAAVALLGPAVWALWRAYNAVEDAFGLDSAAALVLNLVVFVICGFAIGFAGCRLWKRLGGMHKET
jgi:hypothetical protein